MNSTKQAEVAVIAVVMNSDKYLTQIAILREIKKATPQTFSESDARSALFELTKTNVLIETDPETDLIDGAIIDHDRFGSIDGNDLTYLGLSEIFGPGPEFSLFIDRNIGELRAVASAGGMTTALKTLNRLRVDSSHWTGHPTTFVLDNKTKVHLKKLLVEAQTKLEGSTGSNIEPMQALAYIKSALIITDAPEPQPDLLWELIRRGANLASIGSFFLNIMRAFGGST